MNPHYSCEPKVEDTAWRPYTIAILLACTYPIIMTHVSWERERHDTWIDHRSTCGCFCFPAVGKIRGWFGLVRRGWKMHGSSKRLARSRCLPARRTNVVLVTRDATSRLGPLWWRTGRHYSQQTGPLWWRGFPRNGAAIFSCRPSWLSIDTLLRFLLGVKPWCSVPERCDTITLHGTTCVYRREARPVWKTQLFFSSSSSASRNFQEEKLRNSADCKVASVYLEQDCVLWKKKRKGTKRIDGGTATLSSCYEWQQRSLA